MAGYVADALQLLGFIKALAAFVQSQHKQKLGHPCIVYPQHLCELDLS
jgi:hypothetical protein